MAGRRIDRHTRLTIGLLGGSFNPAHAGHRHITLSALKALGLDRVWWLVSPQNPLKSSRDTLPFATRLSQAKHVARHPRIDIMDIESTLRSNYTVYTLKYLRKRFPNTNFIWIMGADNMVQFPLWRKWRELMQLAPIVIYDRDNHIYKALAGKMAACYKKYRVTASNLHKIATYSPPAWGVMRIKKHPLSSTAIREGKKIFI